MNNTEYKNRQIQTGEKRQNRIGVDNSADMFGEYGFGVRIESVKSNNNMSAGPVR